MNDAAPLPMAPARLAPLDLQGELAGELLAPLRAAHGPGIGTALQRFERFFALQSPLAERLAFVGAQIAAPFAGTAERFSVGGSGHDLAMAFAGCFGEGVELLSQFATPGNMIRAPLAAMQARLAPSFADWVAAHAAPQAAGSVLDWVPGELAANGEQVLLPADLVLRRAAADLVLRPRAPLSIGCAAGPSLAEARLRALLELIERDAVAQWWDGGRPARALADDDPARAAAAVTITALRGSAQGRRDWLLDIDTGLGVPVLVAASCDLQGNWLACGFAARIQREAAAEAAVREMMQVELAYAVIAAKIAAGGEAALAPADQRHLRRGRTLECGRCRLLHPEGVPQRSIDLPRDAAAALAALLDILSAAGLSLAWLDLSQPDLVLPVVRAIAPGLQTARDSPATARWLQARKQFGGGAQHHHGVDLF